MSDKKECKHEKVYSNECYATLPPKYPWVCRKCLAEGIDVGYFETKNTYNNLILKKKKQGAL